MDEYERLDKEFDKIEKDTYKYPPKRRWRCLSGPHSIFTVIFEREWPSMGKMERTTTKAYLDPKIQELQVRLMDILVDSHTEYYVPQFGDVSEILKKE